MGAVFVYQEHKSYKDSTILTKSIIDKLIEKLLMNWLFQVAILLDLVLKIQELQGNPHIQARYQLSY
jgi:hypothetical protein